MCKILLRPQHFKIACAQNCCVVVGSTGFTCWEVRSRLNVILLKTCFFTLEIILSKSALNKHDGTKQVSYFVIKTNHGAAGSKNRRNCRHQSAFEKTLEKVAASGKQKVAATSDDKNCRETRGGETRKIAASRKRRLADRRPSVDVRIGSSDRRSESQINGSRSSDRRIEIVGSSDRRIVGSPDRRIEIVGSRSSDRDRRIEIVGSRPQIEVRSSDRGRIVGSRLSDRGRIVGSPDRRIVRL